VYFQLLDDTYVLPALVYDGAEQAAHVRDVDAPQYVTAQLIVTTPGDVTVATALVPVGDTHALQLMALPEKLPSLVEHVRVTLVP
jgi:hypothetical protein